MPFKIEYAAITSPLYGYTPVKICKTVELRLYNGRSTLYLPNDHCERIDIALLARILIFQSEASRSQEFWSRPDEGALLGDRIAFMVETFIIVYNAC